MTKKKVDITQIYIRDDLGHVWYYHPKDGKIKLVLADLEATSREDFEDNGYYCDSLEHGIQLLNEYGYITGIEYDDHYSDDYQELKSHAGGW